MIRCNLTFNDSQFKTIKKKAKKQELKPATWIKFVALQAAGILFNPDMIILPKRITQTELFESRKR